VLVGGLFNPKLARFACDGMVLHAAVVLAIAFDDFDGSGLCGDEAGDGIAKHHALGGFSLGHDGGEVDGGDGRDKDG